MDHSCASVEIVNKEVADIIRVVTDDIEILGKVETLDEVVDHEERTARPRKE